MLGLCTFPNERILMITVRRHSFENGKRLDESSHIHLDNTSIALLEIASQLKAGGVASGNRGRICVKTELKGRTDESYYKGDRDSMRVLTNFVHLYEKNAEDAPSLLIHPELTTLLLSDDPSYRMKIAVLIAYGVNCPTEVGANDHREIEEIITAAQMFHDGECTSISEAFETLTV